MMEDPGFNALLRRLLDHRELGVEELADCAGLAAGEVHAVLAGRRSRSPALRKSLTPCTKVLSDDWMGMPVWARNLAFRLACLQLPDDPALQREAAADLLSFGPDWDDEANAMLRQAEALEAQPPTDG